MRSCRLLSLLALLAAGCGGAGEARQANDGAPPVDAPIDLAGGPGGGTGTGGAAGGTGGGAGATGGTGGTATGAEIGAACTAAADCKSGLCFDDICCRSDCSGLCQSCAQPGSIGTCMNVPVGADPRNECLDDGVAGCMRDGFCDGTGACAVYARGTICRPQSCTTATVTHAALCDGDGTCGATNADSCGQYLCGSDGKCRSSCATAADCVSGAACVNGSCGPKPPGAPCSAGGECASAFCAQGVCCKTACAGTCKSCAIAGSEGECIDAPSGTDPLSQCADEGAMTCGNDGTCDGAGACRQYSGATTCAGATCAGSTATPARTCNGGGLCLVALPVSCAPYLCDGGGGACRTTCAGDADCLAPNVCMGTACVAPGIGGAGGGAGSGGATGSGGGGGMAGTTGTGGTSGTSGAGGGAGTTGVAGAGGAAGTPGAGGAAGPGGTSGTGGAAGTSGVAGTTGAAGRGGSSGTGGAGCPGYAFCDDFEDGDTIGWIPNGGTWSVITDGSRVYQAGNGNSFSLAGQPTWTDQTITARVKVTQWGGTSTSYRAGIVARATDASNFYVFAMDASGALRLLKGTSSPSGTGATGTCGKVTPAPLAAAGTWYTMQLKVVGTGASVSLSTFFNGTLIHDCQTTVGALSAGAAGTYIYGPNTIAEFDDVKISTP